MDEPQIRVGIIQRADRIAYELSAGYVSDDGSALEQRSYVADSAAPFHTMPAAPSAKFAVNGVEIGIGFHWNKKERQEFRGGLRIQPNAAGGITLVNELGLESYLESVISSEMSEESHAELLKAHSVIARSWVIAQLNRRHHESTESVASRRGVISKWYDRENHSDFDFCGDDHCQRYQGVTRALTSAALEAVEQTRGEVLLSDGDVCDTRYSKCCGGMTERFASAWEDRDVSYLSPVYDGDGATETFQLPLSAEANAQHWISSSPEAFCNTEDRKLLERILPDFDRSTRDFYRWKVTVTQDEVRSLLKEKLGEVGELGPVHSIVALERGPSSRIVRLLITGEKGSLEVGKELEIRRVLSKSHLYSSAFLVDGVGVTNGVPEQFIFNGAGWGHGVGLCQIGAAVMAERGYRYQEILAHYFRGAQLKSVYD